VGGDKRVGVISEKEVILMISGMEWKDKDE
jgi:hypothetical protein